MKPYTRFPTVAFGKGEVSVKAERVLVEKENFPSDFTGTKCISYIGERKIVEVDDLEGLAALADYLDVKLVDVVNDNPAGFAELVAAYLFEGNFRIVTKNSIRCASLDLEVEMSEGAPFRDPLVGCERDRLSFYVEAPDSEPGGSMIVYDVSGSVLTGKFHSEEFTRWPKPVRM